MFFIKVLNHSFIFRCHYLYGACVVTTTLLPGIIFAGYELIKGEETRIVTFLKICFPFWFIIEAFVKLWIGAFSNYDKNKDAGTEARG